MEEDMSYVAATGSRSIFEIASSETNRFRAFFRQSRYVQYSTHARRMRNAAAQLCEAIFKKQGRIRSHPGERFGVFLFENNTEIWRIDTDDR